MSAKAANFVSPRLPEPGTILYVPGHVAGNYATTPKGCILHGTRSGRNQSTEAEFNGTVNYVRNGASGLGWSCTVGDSALAIHIPPTAWGWNARAASRNYLAVEFAQPTADRAVSDAQVETFCWWLREYALKTWPDLPLQFPTHAEVERWGETGANDGKSDVFPFGDDRAVDLRGRIMARLG